MKTILLLAAIATLGACQRTNINTPCYTCNIYTNGNNSTQARQTKEFCDKAEMDRYVSDMKSKPETALIECRNK